LNEFKLLGISAVYSYPVMVEIYAHENSHYKNPNVWLVLWITHMLEGSLCMGVPQRGTSNMTLALCLCISRIGFIACYVFVGCHCKISWNKIYFIYINICCVVRSSSTWDYKEYNRIAVDIFKDEEVENAYVNRSAIWQLLH